MHSPYLPASFWRRFIRRLARFRRWPSFLTALLTGCTINFTTSPILPVPTPTITPAAAPTEAWVALAPGLERRVYVPPGGNGLAQLVVLRIDPALYTFRAHYRPGDPLSLQRWQAELPAAVAFVNANFFDPNAVVLGLLVADGQVYGQSYQGFGGMFQVQNGQPRVRSNTLEPYAGEALEQAVQAFPMLVADSQASYTNPGDTDVSRRTVVAQDSSGRILFMVTTLVGLSLPALSAYLPTTDMDLTYALNLDGGGSTMMYIGPGPSSFHLRSFDAVPAVLAVYPR